MNLHEYQGKNCLAKFGILFPPFEVIEDIRDLEAALDRLKTDQVVLKVQIHAGGRGKAGGVKLAHSKLEAKTHANNLLNMRIQNQQTGDRGIIARKLLISPLIDFKKEYYIAFMVDRKLGKAVLIATASGGMEIEEVAKNSPEKILKMPVPLSGLFKSYHLLEIAKFMGWNGNLKVCGMKLIEKLAIAFKNLDASLLEINPLVSLNNETLVPLDLKLSIDENAAFRHRELFEIFDEEQISPLEALAHHHDLAYVALDGNIGCMVNGAGLAMATMDIIEFYGGKPANFLDVGGGASVEKIAEGFKIILSDTKVKAILVNIFGGIMNCETLALGLISAAKELGLTLPLVVRMEGTNVEKGKSLLHQSGLKIQIASSLDEAAKKVVESV